MNLKGITKQLVVKNLIFNVIILLFSILINFGLIFFYIFGEQKNIIIGHINNVSNMLEIYYVNSDTNYKYFMNKYVNNLNPEIIKFKISNSQGDVIADSNQNYEINYQTMKFNFTQQNNKLTIRFYMGKNLYGKTVMMAETFIYSTDGTYLGSVECVSDFTGYNHKILLYILTITLVFIIIIIFIFLSNLNFIKSIINPIEKINDMANIISNGNFGIKIENKYDGEIGNLCDTINNMSEKLRLAEISKNDFISSISHELRTPLTAIKGWAETMQLGSEFDKDVMKRGLDIIVHETQRLSGIVEELLDFSKLQSGRMTLKLDKIDILAELGEAIYMLKERAAKDGKTLIYNEPKMVHPIMGDKNRLKQVFINIIDNAIKYTSKNGAISVNISEKDEKICVNVTDNGCGIPKEHLSKVKGKFYKVNSTDRGSGIGLSIVDEIVKLHNGTFEIISEEGFGTIVNIILPVLSEGSSD